MIAMSMTSPYDEYRRGTLPDTPLYPLPAHPLRRAMMRALAMIGLGMGGVAARDDDEARGIG